MPVMHQYSAVEAEVSEVVNLKITDINRLILAAGERPDKANAACAENLPRSYQHCSFQ